MGTSAQPAGTDPAKEPAQSQQLANDALDSTGEMYARAELERRLERIEHMIEKAKQTS